MLTIFPIRHHGLGCAKALCRALADFQPDCILVEGPPEANEQLMWLNDASMKPPVALLVYALEKPEAAVFYPFAEYSPEWQALCYGVKHDIATRFFDLPLAYRLNDDAETDPIQSALAESPLDYLAEIAGFEDGETWWDAMVEERDENVFDAVLAAMTALREAFPETSPHDLQREAHMRLQIKAAEKEGFERIAVVCGAWHAPALLEKVSKKDDEALLKGMPKLKTQATWIAWTNARLTQQSGYGAGITAPRYYAHCWQNPNDDGLAWVAEMAQILRTKRFDVSAAHMMEVWRLAKMTSQLRAFPQPTLLDYWDALKTVVTLGDELPLRAIESALLVGEKMGQVPDKVPKLPLFADIEALHKRLRLPLSSEDKVQTLDLRKPLDLERSVFLHRLSLLGVDWATLERGQAGRGTFAEHWRLSYRPEYHVQIAEKAIYGNTLTEACHNKLHEAMRETAELSTLSALLHQVLPADLPESLRALSVEIERRSVDTQDVGEMLASLSPLCEILRYGTVRDFDPSALAQVLQTLLIRLEAGGVLGCGQIDDAQASTLQPLIQTANYALGQLADQSALAYWRGFVQQLASHELVHQRLSGLAVRLLFEQSALSVEETAQRFSQALSPARAATEVAAWLEGFLLESGTLLLLHEALWALVFDWVAQLDEARFIEVLPLLRRTFASFEAGERRQLGEKVKSPKALSVAKPISVASELSPAEQALGEQALRTMAALLGLEEMV